jgi:hypothetical protein
MNISPRKIGGSLHPLLKKEVLTKVYRRGEVLSIYLLLKSERVNR